MTIEEAESYIKGIKAYTFYSIKIKPWPPKPFEAIDHYIDIQLCNNLVASEKLSELTLDVLFERCDSTVHRFARVEYEDWKKKELRNHRLSLIIE